MLSLVAGLQVGIAAELSHWSGLNVPDPVRLAAQQCRQLARRVRDFLDDQVLIAGLPLGPSK